ncbi:MAG: hypothetical protein WBO24_03595 [Nitrospirales bacterium]
MAALKSEVPTKSSLVALSAILVVLFLVPSVGNGQSISDLESRADRFYTDAQSQYRLDNVNMNLIWEAYCGRFDPKMKEDKEYAALIGQQLQSEEKDILKRLLEADLPPLVDAATKLLQDPDTKDRSQVVLEKLKKEESNLLKLNDGVVLKGSNHPFVQYAIEYGKKQHLEMCDDYGESPRVCDKDFPGADGRPDLVAVTGGHLVVYEFKPDNSKAKDLGWKQVERYLVAVANYYQNFFEDGRNGGLKNEPDSNHGGKEILMRLKESKDAWRDDGKYLQAIPEVKTYSMCEKRFN